MHVLIYSRTRHSANYIHSDGDNASGFSGGAVGESDRSEGAPAWAAEGAGGDEGKVGGSKREVRGR